MQYRILEVLNDELRGLLKNKSMLVITLLVCSLALSPNIKREILIIEMCSVVIMICYTVYLSITQYKLQNTIKELSQGFIRFGNMNLIKKIEKKYDDIKLNLNNCTEDKEKKIWYIS